MSSENKGFDVDRFYRALRAIVWERLNTWRDVSAETGINPSTFSRMKRGRNPDAASLAALFAWSGLKPTDFVRRSCPEHCPEALNQISSILRADPNLDVDAATAMEAIVRVAYNNLRKSD
jgi:hypothetical protein